MASTYQQILILIVMATKVKKGHRKVPVKHHDVDAKVVRGEDWCYENQDTRAIYGFILEQEPGELGWVSVDWVNEEGKYLGNNHYRIGAADCYDLYYYEDPNHNKPPQLPEDVSEFVQWVLDKALTTKVLHTEKTFAETYSPQILYQLYLDEHGNNS